MTTSCLSQADALHQQYWLGTGDLQLAWRVLCCTAEVVLLG